MSLERSGPDWKIGIIAGNSSRLTPSLRRALNEELLTNMTMPNSFLRGLIKSFMEVMLGAELIDIKYREETRDYSVIFRREGVAKEFIVTEQALLDEGLAAFSKAMMAAIVSNKVNPDITLDEYIRMMNLPEEETKRLIKAMRNG